MVDRSVGASTREWILTLLCGGNRTVAELADAVGISRSAIKVHLGELERDGRVVYERVRGGVGKPAHLYQLTRAGEELLSRAYLPLTDGLLAVLSSRIGEQDLDAILEGVGHYLAAQQPRPAGSAAERVQAGERLLGGFGGIIDVETVPDGAVLCGRCCPVGALAAKHPQVCMVLQVMLADYLGLPVRECCSRTGRPSCRFEVSFAGAVGPA